MAAASILMQEQQQQEEGPSGEGVIRNIVFFDVETTAPGLDGEGRRELLEFGAVVLDAGGLWEVGAFHTLIRPKDTSASINHSSISHHMVTNAPEFTVVAGIIHSLLDGHIWAGHNIQQFDIARLNEAFSGIGRQPPQPSGVIDTYPLLMRTFGNRAGNYKLATLGHYFGYGKQEHRSLPDVQMNIDVLRSWATKMFLENNYQDIFTAHQSNTDPSAWTNLGGARFPSAAQVTLDSIELRDPEGPHFGYNEALYYNGSPLQLMECKTRIVYSVHPFHAYDDCKRKPIFDVWIEPSERAHQVIGKCEDLVKKNCGDEVAWRPLFEEKKGTRAARMRIETKGLGSSATYTTKFYRSTSNGGGEISLDPVNPSTFILALPHESVIDVVYGFYVFHFDNDRAGVRLLAKHMTLL